jgi:TonB-linked SusC/RagA family outer membrane protein
MKRLCSFRGLVYFLSAGVMLLRVPILHAQSATLTGRVMSESGQPIENGNVFITELNISVGTNAQGRYTLAIPAERVRNQSVVLRVRAIAHLAQARPITIRAGAQTNDFELKRDINRLQEVVVTGVTGATEQKKTTFTVATLNRDVDMPIVETSALSSLAGKIAGATVVGANGRPGVAPDIVLRGAKSINASGRDQGPLIIVDGVLLNGNSSDLNPEDIESIEVVKGAAGASLYGSRAENGVISIKTKRASDASQGIRIDARQESGFSNIQGTYHFPLTQMLVMNEDNTRFCIKQTGLPMCSRTIDWDTEAFRINDFPGPNTLTPYSLERDYGIANAASKPELKGLFMVNPWPKRYSPVDAIKTANPYLGSTFTLSGKQGGTGYFTSFNNTIQQGAVKYEHGYTRQTARANIDQQVGSNLTASLQTMFSRSTLFPDNASWFGLTREHAAANLNAVDSHGRLFYRPDITAETSQDTNDNPLYFASAAYGRLDANRFLGSLSSRYTVTNWLYFESTTSIDDRRSDRIDQQDKGYRTVVASPTNLGTASDTSAHNQSYNILLSGTATHNFGSDLVTRMDLRYTYEDQLANQITGSGNTLVLPGLLTLTNATTSLNPGYTTQEQRAVGYATAFNAGYKDRYFFDGSLRKDGSSLFGADQRYHNYYRASGAWLLSEEPWWKFRNAIDEFKFRGAVGTAGGWPRFSAQYEAFTIGAGGSITANTLGNKNLRPENTLETEYGIDAELFHKYGVTLTYARDITTDQLLQVPPSVSSGFSSQWKNAGTMDGRTWEASLNVPIINKRALAWTSRLNWDQTRTYITRMDVPDFFATNNNANIRYAVGERYGNVYGKKFVTSCDQLPSDFVARCGSGKDWQANDQGYIVWVGAGNTYKDGVTKNLWQAQLLGCSVNGVPTAAITGAANCQKAGGTVNTPWGQPTVNWGMLQVIRDSTASPRLLLLGNSQPLWKMSWSHNVQYKRMALYALFDKTFGGKVYNQDRQWSFGDFMTADDEQSGKTVENAKPIGYYWRAPAPDNAAGVGGYYDVLGPNAISFEDASYVKLREMSFAYNVGAIKHLAGDWSISVVGRNLYTWTKFAGWDPDIGQGGGNTNSGALFGAQAASYPASRTFTFALASKF